MYTLHKLSVIRINTFSIHAFPVFLVNYSVHLLWTVKIHGLSKAPVKKLLDRSLDQMVAGYTYTTEIIRNCYSILFIFLNMFFT